MAISAVGVLPLADKSEKEERQVEKVVIHQFNRLIRNKWIWGVFAVAISVFFAFDFLFTGREEGRSGGGAGTLGGKDVSSDQFRTIAEDIRGLGRQRNNAIPVAKVNREAWETLAALSVAKDAHLTATDDDVRDTIRRDQSFQEGGAFSSARYQMLLRENYLTPERFEDSVRRNLTMAKLTRVVLGGAAWVSPMELDEAINDWTDKFTVRIATFADKASASVKLDDAGLEAYYKDNTNSIAMPDCVTVKYVKLMADAPARLAGFSITDDELHDRYDATSSRFETTGTNGVTVTKKFEEVKSLLERELQLIASLEAYRTNLLFRVYPPDGTVDPKTDMLEKIAAEEKQKVQTSPLFAPDGRSYVQGFMSRPSAFVPDCAGFADAVAELDPESADLRYGVVAGTNAVYLVERASFVKAHVPSFAEAKEIIRPKALAAARAKAFKESVEKQRALAAAALAKGKQFDAKLFTDANVTTSITFSVSALQRNSFPNAMTIAPSAMKLSKGQISDFIELPVAGHGLLVYVVDRVPGDAAATQMVRMQLRDDLGRLAAGAIASDWTAWNLDRVGFTTTASTSVESSDEGVLEEE